MRKDRARSSVHSTLHRLEVVRRHFAWAVIVFIRTLLFDKFHKLSTVRQILDGSLEGSSAPRILEPEHAQMRNIFENKGSVPMSPNWWLVPARGPKRIFHKKQISWPSLVVRTRQPPSPKWPASAARSLSFRYLTRGEVA